MPTKRILAIGTSFGGGNWTPLAAMLIGLHRAGHSTKCFGDDTIERELAPIGIPVETSSQGADLSAFMADWRSRKNVGPAPFCEWANACMPRLRDVVRDWQPDLVVSEIFTAEAARICKQQFHMPWVCINPGYYFGPGCLRTPESDYGPRSLLFRQQFEKALEDADFVLHATDPRFDPPPPSLPKHHHYVGPLWWERPVEVPAFLGSPGAPWILVTVSSAPQPDEMQLVRTALRVLSARPVRCLVTLSDAHRLEEIGPVPANARIERFVSHATVLPHCCLVLSHAGHGIVMKALSFGVPMVLVPWDRDQPGVAARAASIGAAVTVPRQELSEDRLSCAIDKILGDASYRDAALLLASILRGQDNVSTARGYIERFLAVT